MTNSGTTETVEQCECILHDKVMSTPDGRITNELKRRKSLSAVGLRHTGTGASGMLDVQCTCSVYFDFVCVSRFGNIRSLCVRVEYHNDDATSGFWEAYLRMLLETGQ